MVLIKFAYLSLSFSFREIPVEKGFLDLTTQEDRCVIHFFHEDFRRCAIMDTHLEVIIQECPQKCPIFFMYEFQWIKLMHTLIEVTLMINFYFIPRITVILFIFMGIMKYWGHYVHVHIYTCLCVKIALEISFVLCTRMQLLRYIPSNIDYILLQALTKKYFETKFAKINVDKAKYFVEKLKIRVLPAVLCFKNGVVVDR